MAVYEYRGQRLDIPDNDSEYRGYFEAAGEHTFDYSEGGCRQVKDAEISMNMGWGTPAVGSALIMRR